MLSTTDHVSFDRPAGVVSINDCRARTSASVQARPMGTSCSDETMVVAPVWRTSSSVTGLFGPNHLQPCFT
jgi:hypothetical protein